MLPATHTSQCKKNNQGDFKGVHVYLQQHYLLMSFTQPQSFNCFYKNGVP